MLSPNNGLICDFFSATYHSERKYCEIFRWFLDFFFKLSCQFVFMPAWLSSKPFGVFYKEKKKQIIKSRSMIDLWPGVYWIVMLYITWTWWSWFSLVPNTTPYSVIIWINSVSKVIKKTVLLLKKMFRLQSLMPNWDFFEISYFFFFARPLIPPAKCALYLMSCLKQFQLHAQKGTMKSHTRVHCLRK